MIAVDADLQFTITPGAGPEGQAVPISGSVTGHGSKLRIFIDGIGSTDRAAGSRLLRELGRVLAANGLEASVHGPRGILATVGNVQPSLFGRLFIRSRHVRLGSLSTLLRTLRSSRSSFSIASLVPPLTPWPLAPTFRRLPRRITTTHDPESGGRPRLFFAGSDNPLPGEETYVFYLRAGGVTTIGSAAESHLLLDGIEHHQAEIRRNELDEYVLVATGSAPCRVNGRLVGRVNGQPGHSQYLRTGSRIDIGSWSMIYFRLEHADHGRPYGGRIGGEAGHQRPQGVPVYRRPPHPN